MSEWQCRLLHDRLVIKTFYLECHYPPTEIYLPVPSKVTFGDPQLGESDEPEVRFSAHRFELVRRTDSTARIAEYQRRLP